MGERPKGLGKVAENGTLNENGAFYSVQDINVLLEEKGSGGDLPAITGVDDGKVLTADDGKWVAGDAPKTFALINCTIEDNAYVLDKTFAEIYEYWNDGVPCFVKYFFADTFTTLDDTYEYACHMFLVVKVFKYDTNYRVYCLAPSNTSISDVYSVGTPGCLTFGADNSTDYPVLIMRTYTGSQYLIGVNTL